MFKITLYLLLLAFLHAKLELQIEGRKAGWALNLPCWRLDNLLTRLLFGKEITGYHYWMVIIFLLMFHSHFLFINWSLSKEFYTLGCYFFYWIVEDFFWFLLNPLYRFRNFKKGKIYWHKRWWMGCPVSYWMALIIGGGFLWLGTL